MDLHVLGRLLLGIGIAVTVVGALLMLAGGSGTNLGRLPGDLRIEGDSFTCLIPVVSSILLSIVLSIILNIIIRLLNRP